MAVIVGTDNDDVLKGTDAGDDIYGENGDDLLRGGGGDDRLWGAGGSDTLLGQAGADSLSGSVGEDSLDGGAGDDKLIGGEGADTLVGGTGDDRIFANDNRTGNDGLADSAFGGDGDDILSGGSGDTLSGGAGADVVDAGVYDAAGVFEGGSGRDLLTFGVAGGDYTGDLGYLADQKHGDVTVEGVTLGGFEGGHITLNYSSVQVTLSGRVHGWAVDLNGGGTIVGNADADHFQASGGAVTLQGLGGDDVLSAGFRSSGILLDGGEGDNTLSGGVGQLDGGAGDDRLTGSGTLDGGVGDDLIRGEGANSQLIGGEGVDTLIAGAGPQTLSGGAGSDVYVFETTQNVPAQHAITIDDADFGTVDLSRIDADPGGNDDAFTVVDAFDGHAGELTIHYARKDAVTHVEADTDGDGKANLVILIEGQHTDSADFVL